MTVPESNETSSTEKLILRALVISLILHFTAYSLWRVGQAQGWWQNVSMPRWMQAVSKLVMPLPVKKPAAEILSQTLLTFVEVDPSLATTEPPKKPMFEGAKNTVAANREVKTPSLMPNITGKQDNYLKTMEDAKHTPAAVKPAPPPKPAQPATVARTDAPKQSYVPGDMALARPSEKPLTGKAEAEPAQPAQPQTVPDRPRTLAEARARNGIPGQQSRLAGGVPNVSADTSLDVKGTPLGDYIDKMVQAVRAHWFQILQNQSTDMTGKVVLRFRLHSDGQISDMTPLKNEVGDLMEIYCERSIKEPASYGKWPAEMLHEIGAAYYDITFTFYYDFY
ncbi:MAG TPA: hypothetical protein VGO59_18760 [Verrucomicrobiae bacterium]